ncbi:MAG: metal ABC transporter substrate-binding protein, partial [Bacteriovoracaceae bacterium]
MKSLIVFIFSFLIFFPIANAKERIFVSFYPLEYSVKFLVGDSIDVWNPVDSDPADWAPSKAQIKKIQESKLIFINGAGFEKWPKVVALPKSKLVVTSRSFKKSWLRYKKGKAHSHGGKVHIHRGFDGHTWMSPNRFLMQNKIIYETIKRAKLVDSKLLDQRFNELQSQFNELEKLWL